MVSRAAKLQIAGTLQRRMGYEFYAYADRPACIEALKPLVDDWQDIDTAVRATSRLMA